MKNFYSLPHKYVGKQIDLKFSNKMVYAYLNSEILYGHKVARGTGHYITNVNHYPERKVVALQMNIQAIYNKAQKVGENTLFLIKKLFGMPRFPLKNLRKVQSILALSERYSQEAMEYASESALETQKYSYNFINSCAKNYREKKDMRVNEAPTRQLEFICLQGGKSE
jgi:hypothetical protein